MIEVKKKTTQPENSKKGKVLRQGTGRPRQRGILRKGLPVGHTRSPSLAKSRGGMIPHAPSMNLEYVTSPDPATKGNGNRTLLPLQKILRFEGVDDGDDDDDDGKIDGHKTELYTAGNEKY